MARGLVLKGNDYNLLIKKGLQKLNITKAEAEIKVYKLKEDDYLYKVKIIVKGSLEDCSRDDSLEENHFFGNSIQDFLHIDYTEEGVFLTVKDKIEDADTLVYLENYLSMLNIIGIDRNNFRNACNTKAGEAIKIAQTQDEIEKDEEVIFEISKDNMKAYITLYPKHNGKDYDDEAMLSLFRSRIKFGLNEQKLSKIIGCRPYFRRILIAEGKPPVDGKNGKVKLLVDLSEDLKPDILEDGTVDYRNVHNITVIQKDQVIAIINPPEPGIVGTSLDGTEIPAKDGKKANIVFGNNVFYDEASQKLISEKDGYVKRTGDRLDVVAYLEVKNDVDNSTGNIKFNGSVKVKGNVHTGFSIFARDGIEVLGVAEGALLESEQDIILKNGMHGNEKGKIKTKGSVIAKYLSNCVVSAKQDVKCGSILHCKLAVEGDINVLGHNATIVGGIIKCKGNINATQIGSEAETPTTLEVGVDPVLKQRYEELTVEMRNLTNQMDNMEKSVQVLSKKSKAGTLDDKNKQKLLLMINDLKKHKQEFETIKLEYTSIEAKFEQLSNCKIRIDDKVYPGVKITIGNDVMFVRQVLNKCSIYRNGGEITVGPY